MAEEQRWMGAVNAAVEAITLHVVSKDAHPQLLELTERATRATERMERMMVGAAPDDVAKYLPSLIEQEKRSAAERQAHHDDLRRLTRRITFLVPLGMLFLGVLDVLLRVYGH